MKELWIIYNDYHEEWTAWDGPKVVDQGPEYQPIFNKHAGSYDRVNVIDEDDEHPVRVIYPPEEAA